jgi:hypothetical protein
MQVLVRQAFVPVTVILVLVVMKVLFATPPKNMQALKALQ